MRLRSGVPPLAQVLALAVFLTGCATRSVPPTVRSAPPRPLDGMSYIDLQAGWRVSVITPLLKSGKYRLEPKADREAARVTGSGNTLSVTMSAGSEFIGYEKSYYAVEGREGRGVRVRFSSAETVQDGKTAPQKRPVVALFGLPRNARHVRLVYLLRRSKADHDMAVLGARDPEELQSLTREVQSDPARACRSRRGRFCEWVPAGIAARPELRRGAGGDWVPAR